jgi:hypothetical protein
MAKLNKEQISEILKSIHPKENDDPVDKYTELLKTVAGNQSSGIDPMMMMLLGNNGGNKSLDKLYEMVALKQTLKMLSDDDKPKDDIKELIKSINESTDKKLIAIQESFKQQLEAFKDIIPKPKSDEAKLLEHLVDKLDKAEKTGNTDEVDTLIKLLSIIQTNKTPEKDPLDTFGKMYEMVNSGNERYIGLKEELLKQQNQETQEQLKQALRIIDRQKDDSDWMSKLEESTSTINQFKTFMEKSGLKPVPQQTEGGKVDLKYILDTVSEVVKNVAPNLSPPRRNPSWDVDKEASKLYTKYKDVLGQEDGTPLTLDFVKNELQKNPNVENIWQAHIKKAYEEQNMQMPTENPDMGEPVDTNEEIEKMFKELGKDVEPTPEPESKETTTETNEVPQGKHIKGMSA